MASIFVLLVMSLMASGTLQFLHELDHEREDAAADARLDGAPTSPQPAKSQPHPHSHDDCGLCFQFRAPALAGSWTVLMLDSGEWVRYVSMLAISQRSQTSPMRPPCRGPPDLS
jgi:hypothetical protein